MDELTLELRAYIARTRGLQSVDDLRAGEVVGRYYHTIEMRHGHTWTFCGFLLDLSEELAADKIRRALPTEEGE